MKTFNPIRLVTRKLGSVVGLGITLLFGFLLPQAANAAITGSAHDFSTSGWNPSDEICIVCHTPHNAGITAGTPLWNHTDTAVSNYSVYVGVDIDANGGTVPQPGAISKLCLSCHDGTVALDSFGGGGASSTFIGDINATAEIGTDLTNDHPVGITYNDALRGLDSEIHLTSNTFGATGITVASVLFSNAVECASCHDVHNSTDLSYLLRIDNSGSDLCLGCHDK